MIRLRVDHACQLARVLVPALVLAALLPPARGDEVASLLPRRTIAYARLSEPAKLCSALIESGLADEIVREGAGEAARGFLQWGLTTGAKSLHVSLHEWTQHRQHVDLRVLMIADLGRNVRPHDWLPPMLAGMLTHSTPHGDTIVYALRNEGIDRSRNELLLTVIGNMLIAASDRFLIEDVIDAAAGAPIRSLSAEPDYQEAMQAQAGRDLQVYVSVPQLLRVFETASSRGDWRELRVAVELLGLEHIRCVSYGQDYNAPTALLRALADTDNRAYSLIARPATGKRLPALLPQQTLFFLTANVGNGAETWDRLSTYLATKLLRTGVIRSRERFEGELAEAEAGLNCPLDRMAGAVRGDMGFLFVPQPGKRLFDDENMCWAAAVQNEQEARDVLTTIGEAIGRDMRTEDVAGVALHVVRRDLAWAVADGWALFGPTPEPIRAVLRAVQDTGTLDAVPNYHLLGRQLPAKSAYMAYMNMRPIFDRMLRGRRGERRHVPAWQEPLALGVGATVDKGTIELSIACARAANTQELFAIIGRLMVRKRAAREPPR